MSFCIAKIIDNKLHIHSDTLMTGEDVVRHSLQKHSVLKSILINHKLCISFAGNIGVAHGLIEEIHKTTLPTFPSLISHMLNHHLKHDKCTDYIIAATFNNQPRIFEIKNGNFTPNLTTSWVGTKEAFRSFQEHFEQAKGKAQSLSSSFSSAFSSVMSDHRVSEVGGFKISISQHTFEKAQGKPEILNYENYMQMFSLQDEEFRKRFGFWNTMLTTSANGGFCYSTLPVMTLKYPGIAIYFGHIKLGLLFCYQKFGFEPKEFRNCTSLQFAKKLKTHGISLKGNAYEGDGGIVQILLGDE